MSKRLVLKKMSIFLVETIERFGSTKKTRIKSVISRLIAKSARIALKTLLLVPQNMDPKLLNRFAEKACPNADNKGEVVKSLTAFVSEEIMYAHTGRWMKPEKVIALGVGDCKNQATLLHSLLGLKGVDSHIAIGLMNKSMERGSAHAWVKVMVNGDQLYCDTTISSIPMSLEEFKEKSNGFIDITPEYLTKVPHASYYGVQVV